VFCAWLTSPEISRGILEPESFGGIQILGVLRDPETNSWQAPENWMLEDVGSFLLGWLPGRF